MGHERMVDDEHDPAQPSYVPTVGDGIWVMAGDVHLDEVERAIDLDLPRGEYETIAGLVIQQLGDFPPVGAVVDVECLPPAATLGRDPDAPARVVRIEVLEVGHVVPSRVRVTVTPEGGAA